MDNQRLAHIMQDHTFNQKLQRLCEGVITTGVRSTGDSGMGGECPFCFEPCCWNDDLCDVKHKPDCIYLIADDLSIKLL